MNQRSYNKEVLKHVNMEKCNPVGPPFNTNSKLLRFLDEEFGNVQRKIEGAPYKAMVGFLMYIIMATRADIVFAVRTVSQFISKANPPHWMAMKYIMRYLKGTWTSNYALEIRNIALRTFCNVD